MGRFISFYSFLTSPFALLDLIQGANHTLNNIWEHHFDADVQHCDLGVLFDEEHHLRLVVRYRVLQVLLLVFTYLLCKRVDAEEIRG